MRNICFAFIAAALACTPLMLNAGILSSSSFVLFLGKKIGKRPLENIKKNYVDKDRIGCSTTVVLMLKGEDKYWKAWEILTDVSGMAVVAKIKGVYPDSHVVEVENVEARRTIFDIGRPLQLITYGAPGTGKSFGTDSELGNSEAKVFRTTFHPDSDYSTFVGAYKPVMNDEKIAYEFRPQAFMKAYVRAWQEMVNPENEKVKNVVLVIEEINRGNCAQVFGDLFQLLDRGNGGYSTYPIEADTDLATWLAKDDQLGNKLAALPRPEDIKREDDWSDILSGKKLALPPNLYIWATMNTSDQSLFPIDSAFKRRWDWEYVPIAKPDKSDDPKWKVRKIEVGDFLFDWWDFLVAINGHITKATESEDKQLGYFFVKADDTTGYISADTFANKVLFYLYGDVFKSYSLPGDDCFKVNGEMLRFRDFFSDEPIKENEKKSRVKLDRLEAFLSGLKWDGKGVAKTNKSTGATSAPKEESLGDGSTEAPKEA